MPVADAPTYLLLVTLRFFEYIAYLSFDKLFGNCINNTIKERAIENEHLYISCSTCGKEFNNLASGVIYLSTVIGKLEFCSDECCRDYLKKNL